MIYLDYQATTPLAPEAREAMLPWLDKFGNPHSPHRLGREARAAVELAREQVLRALVPPALPEELPADLPDGWREGAEAKRRRLGLHPDQMGGSLFFTSGATEAANWAIKGAWRRRPAGRDRVVTFATEHACVLDSLLALRGDGAEVVVLPVDHAGRPDPETIRAAVDERTALVAAMLVNNEIGTIQDIGAIGAHAQSVGATMFCDAVQGFGRTILPLGRCDLVAVSAHKVHGPKGVGALWVRDGHAPAPLLDGGGQEGGLRSGTLSPMLCSGFGAAAALLGEREEEDRRHVIRLGKQARAAFGSAWTLNGAFKHRYGGNLNLRRDGLDAARLISEVRSVAFSAGSACASGSGRPSHVLRAIGLSDAEARSSIRLGFGRYTTLAEIEEAAALLNVAADRQQAWAA